MVDFCKNRINNPRNRKNNPRDKIEIFFILKKQTWFEDYK